MLEMLLSLLEDIGKYAVGHPDLAATIAAKAVRIIRGNPSPSAEAEAGMVEGLARMRADVATTAMMRERKKLAAAVKP